MAVILAVTARVVLLRGKPRELAETPFTVVWKLRSRPKGTVEMDNGILHWRVSTSVGYNTNATAIGRYNLGDLTVSAHVELESVQSGGMLRLELVESARGLSRARNAGLRMIAGDIVSFPDDDCWYPPDLLQRVADASSVPGFI